MFVLFTRTDSNRIETFNTYETEKGAKTAQTRYAKTRGLTLELATYDEYQVLKALTTKMVTRRNLMTGEEYQEAEGTPGHMSPASERYWSM